MTSVRHMACVAVVALPWLVMAGAAHAGGSYPGGASTSGPRSQGAYPTLSRPAVNSTVTAATASTRGTVVTFSFGGGSTQASVGSGGLTGGLGSGIGLGATGSTLGRTGYGNAGTVVANPYALANLYGLANSALANATTNPYLANPYLYGLGATNLAAGAGAVRAVPAPSYRQAQANSFLPPNAPFTTPQTIVGIRSTPAATSTLTQVPSQPQSRLVPSSLVGSPSRVIEVPGSYSASTGVHDVASTGTTITTGGSLVLEVGGRR